ncbi:hypothetical protein RN001_007819 [Aquatica leii]|uniref:CRAL-TRIO domain-containing protein n=1 Tax=Aquatica leii TaxID=1421715 RepID=A0AAN7SP10_9COLE|nr:hypothetical protein RN001_007819 [Aquatica leii]
MSIRFLSKELEEVAVKELNEKPERRQYDLESIREWISKQPHLKVKTDDQWLINMLRCCKFSLEKTKKRIDLLCSIKTLTPEVFENRDPFLPEIQGLLNCGCVLPLPKENNPIAPRTILIRMLEKTTKYKVIDGIKLILMIFEILINEDDNFIIVGSQVLEDYKELSFKHIQMATPSVVKQAIICLLSTYPVRANSFHVINSSDLFISALYLVKPFLSKKLLSRLHIYNNDEQNQIKSHIPLQILPKEYGGTGPSVEELTAEWKQKVESYKDWYAEDYLYRSDETKRIGNHFFYDDILGTDGSFRKLEID